MKDGRRRDKTITVRVPKIVDDCLTRKSKKLKLSKSEYVLISLCKNLGIEYISEQFKIPKHKKVEK